jgi:hypothetical protein
MGSSCSGRTGAVALYTVMPRSRNVLHSNTSAYSHDRVLVQRCMPDVVHFRFRRQLQLSLCPQVLGIIRACLLRREEMTRHVTINAASRVYRNCSEARRGYMGRVRLYPGWRQPTLLVRCHGARKTADVLRLNAATHLDVLDCPRGV